MLNRAASSIRERSHEARAELFARLLTPHRGARILDLGGGDGSLSARIARRANVSVTVADIDDSRWRARDRHGFEVVRLAEDRPLPFEDATFDIVLCNSVIEHVTLPKSECVDLRLPEAEWRARAFARQRAFAAEIARVGRGYFVQTPHRMFPIDSHTWMPLTNFLSHEGARRLVRVTDRWWVKKCGVADWHLLGEDDMRRLFPGAAIHVERVMGLPKSIIAWRGTAGTD